jgi:hypothetical protein
METSQQRFLDTLDFKPVSASWVRWGSFIRDETVALWKTQGYDESNTAISAC